MVDVILGGRFHLGDRIGAGLDSEVYVATDTTTGTPVAVRSFGVSIPSRPTPRSLAWSVRGTPT